MTEEHDEIETLLREVGLRPQPPDDLMQSAKTASREAWRAAVARQRTRRWQQFGMSAAAVLLLAFVLNLNIANQAGFEVEIAQATEFQVDGQLRVKGIITFEPGSHMTAVAPARLIAQNGVDLRLNATTRVNWLAPDHVYLESGSLYVDTHSTASFAVSTSEGHIRDIGTRYLVAVHAGGVDLAVREGETEVEVGSRTVSVRGDGVSAQVVSLSRGDLVVRDEAASNDRWAWISQVAPDYPDVTVHELLEQVCADLGKRLKFASPGVEAATVNLRIATGFLSRENPSLALEAIVKSSELQVVESADEVVVGF